MIVLHADSVEETARPYPVCWVRLTTEPEDKTVAVYRV
jgi:hypothetical protein